ncbi:MAG TPA: acetyl-CoA carboxylase biotin carboxyl carrier protein [bacterium]
MDNQKFDLDQIRAVIKLASESDLAELTVESPTLKITVKKSSGPTPPALPAASSDTLRTANPSPAAVPATDHLVPIIAPMVGTFYRAPNPEATPFVGEGDVIAPGQTVCVIEAMKLFNEIQSEVGGRIVRVLAENANPVEYGQPLFLIDPTANS